MNADDGHLKTVSRVGSEDADDAYTDAVELLQEQSKEITRLRSRITELECQICRVGLNVFGE